MCEAFPRVSCSKAVTENALSCRDAFLASVQPSPFANKSASDLSPLSSSPTSLSLCSLFQPHLLTLFTSLSFATHLLSSSDQSPTDSHISSRFVFLPFYSAVLPVSDCFILSLSLSVPLFLFFNVSLVGPYHILPALSCLRLLSPPTLYLSLLLMCQPTPVIHTSDGRPNGHPAL